MLRAYATVLLAAVLALPARAASPEQANGAFVSRSYALTFVAPPGLTYCPLPPDWVGSDHGTTLFLTPPRTCGSVGYPSMARDFEPPGTSRIEVYYGRTMDEGLGDRQMPCRRVGQMRFLSSNRPLCATTWRGMAVREVSGRYVADDETEAVFTLVTYPARLPHDLAVFRALAATVHPCALPWRDAQGRPRIEGSGRPCPEQGDFY